MISILQEHCLLNLNIKMTDYYKSYSFTINRNQSDHIDKRVYEDKQQPDNKRKYPNGERSEYIRKMIDEDRKNDK